VLPDIGAGTEVLLPQMRRYRGGFGQVLKAFSIQASMAPEVLPMVGTMPYWMS